MVGAFALALTGCSDATSQGTGTVTSTPSSPAATTSDPTGTPTTAATATSPGTAATTQAPAAAAPRAVSTAEVARFDQPWAARFLPGTPWLAVTEKPGRLVLRDLAAGRSITVEGTPQVDDAGQGGLGDIVPAPGYDGSSNRTIYLTWAQSGDGGTAGAAMGRGTLEITGGSARLVDFQQIWQQSPKVNGSGHYGHRIAFSPDGRYLFLTSGERQKMDPAQDLSTNLGKVLRLNLDGTPAAGNPFADRGGVAAQVWSLGHRNPLGLAFDSGGRLWSSEMGPRGGDEVNLVERGGNYGWPKVSDGTHYDGRDIPDHAPGDGFVAPKVSWNPSISPSSLLIYAGSAVPGWTGDAFIGALSGQALIRVDLSGETATKADQWDLGTRIRDVVQGPDGTLYALEDGSSGRLLRITPA